MEEKMLYWSKCMQGLSAQELETIIEPCSLVFNFCYKPRSHVLNFYLLLQTKLTYLTFATLNSCQSGPFIYRNLFIFEDSAVRWSLNKLAIESNMLTKFPQTFTSDQREGGKKMMVRLGWLVDIYGTLSFPSFYINVST